VKTPVAASDAMQQHVKRLETGSRQLRETNQKTVIRFEKQVAALEQKAATLERKNAALERRNEALEWKKLALFRQFGRHAERFSGEGQPPLFDAEETAAPAAETEPAKTVAVAEHQRKQRGRKPPDGKIPRVDEVIDIEEAEKQCACGADLVCVGEDVSERLALIPEQVYVLRYHVKKYACHECEGSGDEEKPAVRTGNVPASLMPGSIATPELLSSVFTKKYCDYVPYYRQEAAFERIGVELSRQNMANWQQKVCGKLQPLLGLLQEQARSGNVVRMDETPMRVMGEPGRENRQSSYMWLARGGPPGQPALWHECRETRGKDHIAELLRGFRGYLQSDGYGPYESAVTKDLAGVVHVGCFAHVRRRFFEAMKISAQPGLADAALSQIKGLYTVERDLREQLRDNRISAGGFAEERRKRCVPILQAFHAWLNERAGTIPESTKLGDATGYALREWPRLERYLDDWQLTPDNNACERGIRPFVMGRKNFVMSGSPAGARSSCEAYSLTETAKANGWNPFKYLVKIVQKAAVMKPSDDWSQLLPWNLAP
jgi:transposase